MKRHVVHWGIFHWRKRRATRWRFVLLDCPGEACDASDHKYELNEIERALIHQRSRATKLLRVSVGFRRKIHASVGARLRAALAQQVAEALYQEPSLSFAAVEPPTAVLAQYFIHSIVR